MRIIFLFLTITTLLAADQSPGQKAIHRANKHMDQVVTPTLAQKAITRHKQLYARQRIGIKELLGQGRRIVLNDNSIWEVKPKDLQYTGGWISPARVRVKLDGSSQDDYPYTMRNLSTHQTVRVRKFYRHPPSTEKSPPTHS